MMGGPTAETAEHEKWLHGQWFNQPGLQTAKAGNSHARMLPAKAAWQNRPPSPGRTDTLHINA